MKKWKNEKNKKNILFCKIDVMVWFFSFGWLILMYFEVLMNYKMTFSFYHHIKNFCKLKNFKFLRSWKSENICKTFLLVIYFYFGFILYIFTAKCAKHCVFKIITILSKYGSFFESLMLCLSLFPLCSVWGSLRDPLYLWRLI